MRTVKKELDDAAKAKVKVKVQNDAEIEAQVRVLAAIRRAQSITKHHMIRRANIKGVVLRAVLLPHLLIRVQRRSIGRDHQNTVAKILAQIKDAEAAAAAIVGILADENLRKARKKAGKRADTASEAEVQVKIMTLTEEKAANAIKVKIVTETTVGAAVENMVTTKIFSATETVVEAVTPFVALPVTLLATYL